MKLPHYCFGGLYLNAVSGVNGVRGSLDHLIAWLQFAEHFDLPFYGLPRLYSHPFGLVIQNSDDKRVLLIDGHLGK